MEEAGNFLFPLALQASVAPLAIARWVEVSRWSSTVYMYKVDPLWRAKGETNHSESKLTKAKHIGFAKFLSSISWGLTTM